MKNERGFTLLECLVAMAIFAVAMLGVIGLQVNTIKADGETRRKDAAEQLLTAGAEMVACSDYGNTALYSGNQGGFDGFVEGVKSGSIIDSLMTSGDGKASLYLRHQVVTASATVRNVYLVAAWDSVTTAERKTICRMMVKPQNMIQ